jgi:hypothetical protein
MGLTIPASRWCVHCQHDGFSQDWCCGMLHSTVQRTGLRRHSDEPVPRLPIQRLDYEQLCWLCGASRSIVWCPTDCVRLDKSVVCAQCQKNLIATRDQVRRSQQYSLIIMRSTVRPPDFHPQDPSCTTRMHLRRRCSSQVPDMG